jgi:hypothetical protein
MLAHSPLPVADATHEPIPATPEARALADKLRGRAEAVTHAENWRKLDISARMALVMFGCGADADVEYLARRDWGQFSAADRLGMSVAHRRLRDQFIACGVLG